MFIAREFLADFGFNLQFFGEFANQRLLRRFTEFHLAAGKFPLQRMAITPASLTDQNFAALMDDTRCYQQWDTALDLAGGAQVVLIGQDS